MMTTTDDGLVASPPQGRWAWGLSIAAVVVLADVATKQWSVARLDDHPVSWFGGAVRFTHGRNSGAAFGMGTSMTPLLTVVATLAALALAVALLRSRSRPAVVLLGLFLGGVVGNLVDRLLRSPGPMRGHVVDWIDVGAWPTFNLADTSLVIAAAGVILHSILSGTERAPTK